MLSCQPVGCSLSTTTIVRPSGRMRASIVSIRGSDRGLWRTAAPAAHDCPPSLEVVWTMQWDASGESWTHGGQRMVRPALLLCPL